MASHQVKITKIPRILVGAEDVRFEVRENGEKLGDLMVRQGNLSWRPSTLALTKAYVLSWSEFAQLAAEHGRKA